MGGWPQLAQLCQLGTKPAKGPVSPSAPCPRVRRRRQKGVSAPDRAHRQHRAGPSPFPAMPPLYTTLAVPCQTPVPHSTGSTAPWQEVALGTLGPCEVLLHQGF